MAEREPLVIWSRRGSDPEGDCACPDTPGPPPEMHWLKDEMIVEQDCACPDRGTTAAMPALQAHLWRVAGDLYRDSLPDQHQIVFAPAPTARIGVLNPPARRVLDAFATPWPLAEAAEVLPDLPADEVRRVALEMARAGLLQPTDSTAMPCLAPPHTLTAWLHVTSRCNLHCAYCYAARSGEDMAEDTGRTALENLFRSAADHGFRTVKLKYAGGEPTLNFSLVRALHEQAQLLGKQHRLEVREVVLSNGVALTDETLRALRDMGLRLAISLDGIGPAHDAQRGAGSFARTSRSLDRAIALGLSPHVSVTVTNRNVASLPDIVTYLLARDLAFNLNFYREHGPPDAPARLMAGQKRLIEGVRAALAVVKANLPRQSIIGSLLDRVNLGQAHSRPCGAGHSYLAVDPRGRTARCHMELEHPVASIGEDDLLSAIRSPSGSWRNLTVEAKSECATCTWRYWCGGGCPLLSYRTTGRDDVPSPYCAVYRALLPDLLYLEGLRLLAGSEPVD